MEENEDVATKKKGFLSAKNILRILFVLCIGFFFLPSFVVSCSGQDFNVSALDAVTGISDSSSGREFVEPHPVMILSLVLPVLALVLLFIKKLRAKNISIITVIISVANLIVLFLFKSETDKFAAENYCSSAVTPWFTINIIVLAAIILIDLLVLIKKLQFDSGGSD